MKITRRDFVNGTLVGSGAVLLSNLAPGALSATPGPRSLADDVGDEWYGYGGVGDYAASHGNTPELINIAHDVRDGIHNRIPDNLPVEEEYDLVIVGGGMAGLGAAWQFRKHAKPGQNCLMLENHPIFGGEAKENEFEVNGVKLLAPQGANGFFMPPEAKDPEQVTGDARYYSEFNIPRDLSYREWTDEGKQLKFCRDNYQFLNPIEGRDFSLGHFFDSNSGGVWTRDTLAGDLDNAPIPAREKEDLLAWFRSRIEQIPDDAANIMLDSMTYKDYLESRFNLGPAGVKYADAFIASAYGLGSDAISAYMGSWVRMPGTFTEEQYRKYITDIKDPANNRHSFPGGNSGYARYFLKHIKPSAIAGKAEFNDIIDGAINFDALDKPGDSIRMRLSSTVVSVQHEGTPENSRSVNVVYSLGGKLHRIRAKGVVMASGGWINKFIIKDLPEKFRGAYQEFIHAPFLVANVALTNWRFMYELGITCARWDGGFGNSCNIRKPMLAGDHQPPLHPDKPAVLTFYVPFITPGLPARVQAINGRTELFFTSYADYERRIISQMVKLFGSSGFNPGKDISGIILNRWGHAYVVPTPGFTFDTPEKKAPRNIIMEGYGRIAFGHSELESYQHWGPAADQGRRAVEQLFDKI